MLGDLRFGRFWLVFGWLAVVAALVLSLLPPKAVDIPGANDKLEHLIGYLLLTFWFCGLYPRRRYALIALGMLAMGGLVEVLQAALHLGRQAELGDLIADSMGIALAVILAMTPLGRWPRWFEILFQKNLP